MTRRSSSTDGSTRLLGIRIRNEMTRPSNKRMKLTKPGPDGASQLIPSVGRTDSGWEAGVSVGHWLKRVAPRDDGTLQDSGSVILDTPFVLEYAEHISGRSDFPDDASVDWTEPVD